MDNKYGIWRLEQEDENGKVAVSNGDSVLACIFVNGPSSIAHAHLLKAAPRFLTAIEKIIEETSIAPENNIELAISKIKLVYDIAHTEIANLKSDIIRGL